MKNAVITLAILIAVATIATAYLLWTPAHLAGNFNESSGPTAAGHNNPIMLKNAATPYPGCPADTNSSWQTTRLIVTASALFSDSDDADEKKGEGAGKDEEEKGEDKNEDQGVDRLWDACKYG
jgi:hypothetical protein